MRPGGANALTDLIASGDVNDNVFRDMLEALPVAVYTTDAEGRLTYFNPAAVKLSGRVPQLGTEQWCVTWKIFLPDGTPLPHNQCPMALALQGAEIPNGIECIAERPDGSRFWFTPCPAIVRDTEGRITAGINVLVDITDRKNTEIEANEQFRAMVETTPDCVKIVAPDGTLLFMNPPGLEMVAASSPEEVIGKSVYDLIAPQDRDAFRQMNARVCQGERASIEFDMASLTGVRRHMETHAAPLRHTDGSIVHLAVTRDVTKRKEAERDALLLGAIVDSSDDAIISKDLNGVVTSWNKSAERLFGYTAEEAVGQPIAALVIPEDRQYEEPRILDRLRRGERVDHFETIRHRKDGTLLDISLTISPIRNEAGKIIGASKIARDISERKRAERSIQALNDRLTADLSAMTRMHQISTRMMQSEDFEELLNEIVSAGMEITGADAGDIELFEDGKLRVGVECGHDAAFTRLKKESQTSRSAWARAVQRGERLLIEDIDGIVAQDDHSPLVAFVNAGIKAVQSTPLITRNGQVLGILSTWYRTPQHFSDRDLRLLDILARQTADLIERTRAVEALSASESKFRQLADSMPQIVWTARPDGSIDYCNERWFEFTGFSHDSVGQRTWDDVVEPNDLADTKNAFEAAIRSGQAYNVEFRLWDRHEKRFKWFVNRALPVRGEQGKIEKWFGACTGIDEQKRVQDELRRANQDLEQFAFSASHDLQEPLRTIRIYSELLARRYRKALEGDAKKFLEFVCEGAARMETLLSDLLAYTRVTKAEEPIQVASAAQAAQVALSNLDGAIAEAGAHITVAPLPSVRVQPAHLEQLFQNLVSNAIKYRSPERPCVVEIDAALQGGRWVFEVSDNGIGIAPEYQETIFGLFKRLHTAVEYPGTGIGLAICQRIVERYEGRIWVESEVGRGSTFRFTLPG